MERIKVQASLGIENFAEFGRPPAGADQLLNGGPLRGGQQLLVQRPRAD